MARIRRIISDKSGLTLVEILIAMTVLALVAGPICRSLMLSSDINKKARKRLCANDAAQTVMEGFTDKMYDEILESVEDMQSSSLKGQGKFTNVNDNFYNNTIVSSNRVYQMVNDPADTTYNPIIDSVSINKIVISGNTINSADLNKTENLEKIELANRYYMATAYLQMYTSGGLAGGTNIEKNVWIIQDENKIATTLLYTDVENGGYHFDMAVTFLPMAATESDTWFPYLIYMSVYDHPVNNINHPHSVDATDASLMMAGSPAALQTLKSGTRNQRVKK